MGKCYNSIVINASCDKIWSAVRNFHDLSWAKGVVEKAEVVGDKKGDQLGAQRKLNDVFEETLLELNDLDRRLSYSIDNGPGAVAKDKVNNYVGQVRFLPITQNDTTFVEWTSTYDSPDSKAVGELCDPIYVALLGAMQKHFEG